MNLYRIVEEEQKDIIIYSVQKQFKLLWFKYWQDLGCEGQTLGDYDSKIKFETILDAEEFIEKCKSNYFEIKTTIIKEI